MVADMPSIYVQVIALYHYYASDMPSIYVQVIVSSISLVCIRYASIYVQVIALYH